VAVGYITDDDLDNYMPADDYADLEWYLYTTRTDLRVGKGHRQRRQGGGAGHGIDATQPDLSQPAHGPGPQRADLSAGGAPDANDNHGTKWPA
jgi:hypothetical protein